MSQYATIDTSSQRAVGLPGWPLRWDSSTAVALIVLGSLVTLAVLRGSLRGGAVQP